MHTIPYHFHIPATDVFFVVYGSKTEKGEVIEDPYVFSGKEVKQIVSEKLNSKMVSEMKIGKVTNYIFLFINFY